MAEYEVIHSEELPKIAGYAAPFCRSRGETYSRIHEPEGFGQFVLYADLGAGAEVVWDSEHGDEGIFVIEGEVEIDGHVASEKSGIIIESGVPTVLRSTKDSRVLHQGSTVPTAKLDSILGPPQPEDHSVHVFGSDGKATVMFDGGVTYFYADSHCDTCRIALFRVVGPDPAVVGSHTHSVHELITVMAGELKVGRDTAGPMTTLAIPANRRYGFRSKAGYEFINFRLDASYYTTTPGSTPLLEGINMFTEAS